MIPGMTDRELLAEAVALARHCPPSATAFSVGAIVVAADGREIARGWSRDVDAVVHAEESALQRAAGDPGLRGATVYSSLEPCSMRASRPVPCAQLIVAAGVARVVLAWREPEVFVPAARGAELLVAGGVEVVELPELADAALAPNRHILGPG